MEEEKFLLVRRKHVQEKACYGRNEDETDYKILQYTQKERVLKGRYQKRSDDLIPHV